jgi:ParB-like chromosome segregation protein Spo0J
MTVQEMRLDQIKPYKNNPRKNDEAVQAVANSIREFGFKQPIVVDADGVIIVGHTRYKAAQMLGLETVPVLVASDLSDEQAKAYRLADNKTSELAGWDFTALAKEMAGIDMDMSEFGFTEAFDDSVLDDLFTEAEPKEKEPQKIRCPHCGEWFEP